MKDKKQQNKQQAKSNTVIAWTANAWEEYLQWQQENPKILEEINNLLDECMVDPFKGTGKPEPLKGNLTGFWSRRITDKHRLVYLPDNGQICVVMCKYHYSKNG